MKLSYLPIDIQNLKLNNTKNKNFDYIFMIIGIKLISFYI